MVFFACKKDNIEIDNYAEIVLNYAPYKPGSFLIYEVDSTFYDDFKDTITNKKSYLKYTIDSLNNSIKGRTLFRVVVSCADSINGNYQFLRVDQWAITPSYFETQIENIRYTRLIFPVNFESVWNLFTYSNLQRKFRYYTALSDTSLINNQLFDSVVKVENEPLVNNVIENTMVEFYAKKIGLIYKKTVIIETQFNAPNGLSIEQKLIRYKI